MANGDSNPEVQAISDALRVRDAMETMRNVGLITPDDYGKYLHELNDKSHKAIEDYLKA